MISPRTPIEGAFILEYFFTDLHRRTELVALHEAKTVKNQAGVGSYEDIAITDDDYPMLIDFYREFHARLFPVMSTRLYQPSPDSFQEAPGFYTVTVGETEVQKPMPNIEWALITEPAWADENIPETRKAVQDNMRTILDSHIENGYRYYALFKWFALNNNPPLSQKYDTFWQSELDAIRQTLRHNNDKTTRARKPYRIF